MLDREPFRALTEVLLPAYHPCIGFEPTCRGECLWSPDKGHIPRGFHGGNAETIRLVLVTAEPGDPADGESYQGSPAEMLRARVQRTESSLGQLAHSTPVRGQAQIQMRPGRGQRRPSKRGSPQNDQ
jgi:hypothetical protein